MISKSVKRFCAFFLIFTLLWSSFPFTINNMLLFQISVDTFWELATFDRKHNINTWSIKKWTNFNILDVINRFHHQFIKRKIKLNSANALVDSIFIILCLLCPLLKFIHSEKATKFCEISTVDLSYVVKVKSTVEISQNFVAFSEYMNFRKNGCKWAMLTHWY